MIRTIARPVPAHVSIGSHAKPHGTSSPLATVSDPKLRLVLRLKKRCSQNRSSVRRSNIRSSAGPRIEMDRKRWSLKLPLNISIGRPTASFCFQENHFGVIICRNSEYLNNDEDVEVGLIGAGTAIARKIAPGVDRSSEQSSPAVRRSRAELAEAFATEFG